LVAVATPAVAAGDLSGVMLAALALFAMASVEVFSPLAAAAASVDAVSAAAGRLEEITERPVPASEPPDPRPIPPTGDLAMHGVGFAYEEGATLLRGAELRVSPGEAVALVGPSGIGKSTVADLLVRFRDPGAGTVELGGADVRELDSDELRRVVRLAPQDAHLFTTTIRANLALAAPDATEGELIAALHAAGLGDWLAGLPDGLDTHVGEDGALVSGGQRQRIAVARALVARARFLIFDEPTTHLDGVAAERLLAAIAARAAAGKGVLAITHDRTRLECFDRVLALDGGRIREIPSPR
jgi:ABC-type transport system involved in cytochrome bd biosynthesis fused ATPase/permease subunit